MVLQICRGTNNTVEYYFGDLSKYILVLASSFIGQKFKFVLLCHQYRSSVIVLYLAMLKKRMLNILFRWKVVQKKVQCHLKNQLVLIPLPFMLIPLPLTGMF